MKILDTARTPAYGHAARYWVRLGDIAATGVDLSPVMPHSAFEEGVRALHGRKFAFWTRVSTLAARPVAGV